MPTRRVSQRATIRRELVGSIFNLGRAKHSPRHGDAHVPRVTRKERQLAVAPYSNTQELVGVVVPRTSIQHLRQGRSPALSGCFHYHEHLQTSTNLLHEELTSSVSLSREM